MRRLTGIAVVLTALLAVAVVLTSSARSDGGPYTIRAIFDDASYAATDEDVRVAGANVGSIKSLSVTNDNRAAVTITIANRDFVPFYANAQCTIRPQSLIGEEYVDCSPGTAQGHRQLAEIKRGPGAGDYYMPVTDTSSPIDSDIVQDISQMPVRQALSVLIDELGTGLASRGSDLNAVIHRANPALGNTDKVFQILAKQSKQLAQLSTDSDTVLTPLARERKQIAGFITNANTTAVASAARAQDISRTFKLFPTFLGQLRPLLADLSTLAEQGTPLMNDLGQTAGPLGTEFGELRPFAQQTRTALIKLGSSAQRSEGPLVASLPLAQRLDRLGQSARPSSISLQQLLQSLDSTGGIEDLMSLLYNATFVANGYDSLGHYARVLPNPNDANCADFATSASFSTIANCNGHFKRTGSATTKPDVAGSAAQPADPIVTKAVREVGGASSLQTIKGLLSYLTGATG